MATQDAWSAPVFRGMTPEDLVHLGQVGRTLPFVAGETLCAGRARTGILFVLARGSASVMLPDPETGEEKPLVLLKAGDSFGETSLLDGLPRQARIVAKESGICWTLDRAGLDRLKREAPGTAAVLLANLAEAMANRLCRAADQITRIQDRKREVSEDQQRRVGEEATRSLWSRWFGGKRDE